jgi:hypothetical protein
MIGIDQLCNDFVAVLRVSEHISFLDMSFTCHVTSLLIMRINRLDNSQVLTNENGVRADNYLLLISENRYHTLTLQM